MHIIIIFIATKNFTCYKNQSTVAVPKIGSISSSQQMP